MKRIKSIAILKMWISMFLTLFCIFVSVEKIANADPQKYFSIELKNASLAACIQEIAEKSGYEISVIQGRVEKKISIRLTQVGLKEALTAVLKDINHAIIWNDRQHKVALLLFDKSVAGSSNRSLREVFSKSPAAMQKANSALQTNDPENNQDHYNPGDSGPDRKYSKPWLEKKVKLDISGKDRSFVQGTPTGHIAP